MNVPDFMGFATDKEKARANLEGKPSVLIINTNKGCNMRCIYCYQDAGKPEEGQMNAEDYKRIIKEAGKMGIKKLIVAGAGEPFIDKKYFIAEKKEFPLIELANSIGMHVSTYTNATLIDKDVAQRLKEYDVSFMCKLNSFNEEVQNFLTGSKLAKKLYDGIFNLIDAGFSEEEPTRLAIDTLITKHTYKETEGIVEWALKNNIHPVIEGLLYKGRAIENKNDLVMYNDISDNFNFENMIKERIRKKHNFGTSYFSGECDIEEYSIVIDFKGNYVVCPGGRVDASYGNIYEMGLDDAWNIAAKVKTRNKKHSSCGKCAGRIYCENKYADLLVS